MFGMQGLRRWNLRVGRVLHFVARLLSERSLGGRGRGYGFQMVRSPHGVIRDAS